MFLELFCELKMYDIYIQWNNFNTCIKILKTISNITFLFHEHLKCRYLFSFTRNVCKFKKKFFFFFYFSDNFAFITCKTIFYKNGINEWLVTKFDSEKIVFLVANESCMIFLSVKIKILRRIEFINTHTHTSI